MVGCVRPANQPARLRILLPRGDMRLLALILIVAFSNSTLSAQSLISRDSITPAWAQRHLIGGIDAPAPGFGKTWACVKSWPEVTRALIAIYDQSEAGSLPRADAILVLGATGQDSAFRFLVSTLDHAAPDDPLRQEMILALGNSADPPDYVYARLELALTSAGDRGMAARSLSDIRSPRAESVLRKAKEGETSAPMVAALDKSLARFQSGHPRVVTPCDSTMLRRDR
jgi:hypothetical protein